MSHFIQNLYNEFLGTSETTNPDITLAFFMKHESFFNNLNHFESEADLKVYIFLVWQYVNALFQKNRFNETIDSISKFQFIADKNIEKIPIKKDDWYYGILFINGIAYYRLRDYKNAIPIFKKLVTEDSKNENYRLWLFDAQFESRRRFANIIFIVSAALLLIEILSKSIITSATIRLCIDAVSLCGIIFYFIFDWSAKKSRRIIKKKSGVSHN